jgi:hypothetical protein
MGFGEQKAFVDAAVTAGVKRFLPSEFGINGQSEAVKNLTPFFSVKQDLLDYLVEKEKDGLSWTGLITGILYDWVSFAELIFVQEYHINIVSVSASLLASWASIWQPRKQPSGTTGTLDLAVPMRTI